MQDDTPRTWYRSQPGRLIRRQRTLRREEESHHLPQQGEGLLCQEKQE